ncbi:cytoskeleton-associated protein 2-like isoform X2 [Electrophorus electricus]|uniref:cytoskeleton-associated protein 2-like isoform X2 n=1 Tax=Electrophorus electricus TaxID=8005 RepID=UPI0015CFB90E|nr:cytoskeleton-associated protein 2-like isoform X2 [Electrophorus electricus]
MMETLRDEDMSKLSRTELRKQKLAEYLAMKGRLKPPNPKPYLKDSAVLKKNSGEGKENHVLPSAMGAKKDAKTEKTFTKNKNFTTSKLELRTISKAPSAISIPLHFKPSMSQTARQYYGTQNMNGTTFARNASLKQLPSKVAPQKCVGVQQSNTAKIHTRTPFGSSSLKAHGNGAETNFSRKGKESALHNTTSISLLKCYTVAKQPSNTVQKNVEAKQFTRTQIRLAQNGTKASVTRPGQKPRVSHGQGKRSSGSVQFKEPLMCKSQAKPVRTQLFRNKSLLQGTQLNKPGPTTQAAYSSDKTNPTLSSASSKTTKVTRPTTVRVAGVKNAVPQQQRTTVQLSTNPTVQAAVPHTAPRNSKSSSQARGTMPPKTPKSAFNSGTQGVRTVPQDGRNKLTAAQEERLRKLQEWREAKGITYKRPPMPVQSVRKRTSAPPQNYWTTMEQEDEVHGFVCAVDQSLNDCIKLIQQGCPVDQVRDVLSRVPMAEKFAKYWICQVRLMEREGNFDVLPTFEEAVRIVRESVDELRSVVFEILKRKEAKDEEGEKEEHYNSLCTPKPVAVWIHGEKGESSVIKYKITATPSGKIGQKKVKPGQIGGHEIRFFTPVRRSLRIERTAPHFPAALQEHDPCVTSLRELLTQGESEGDSTHLTEAGDSPLYVYRENEALKEQVHVRLTYDEAVA